MDTTGQVTAAAGAGELQKKMCAEGMLSIVVQGGVSESNVVEVANICTHWRSLFPLSEIICVVTSSDIFLRGSDPVRLNAAGRKKWDVGSALEMLEATCDRIAFADAALPLPANVIGRTNTFNANLQLAAAKKGLSLATGKYVLRIRNDILFATDDFVAQYEEANLYPRGKAAVLKERVLIASTFTMNPYGVERYPFHYNDWLHFGLLVDVRKIWDVPSYPVKDIHYYKYNTHVAGSRDIERNHYGRVAIEQHLIFNAFSKDFPEMRLEYHNDTSSRELSIEILKDNFSVCDQEQAGFVFEKYAVAGRDQARVYWFFINRTAWKSLVSNGAVKSSDILYRPWGSFGYEEYAFPKKFDAYKLSTKTGVKLNGAVVLPAFNRDTSGVLVHGPYINLPRGQYVAEFLITTIEGVNPQVVARVTLEHGKTCLAERYLSHAELRQQSILLPFSVADEVGCDLELIVEIVRGVHEMAVEHIVIHDKSSSTLLRRKSEMGEIRETSFTIAPGFDQAYRGTSLQSNEAAAPLENRPATTAEGTKHGSFVIGGGGDFLLINGLGFHELPLYFKSILSLYGLFLGRRISRKMRERANWFFVDAKNPVTIFLKSIYKNLSIKACVKKMAA
ncbi:WavE lipopolysaccharide synthesis family protein [Paraburkholderia sp. 40]|uniref:WavE lipopolysaccharide synthesis family protein n=1 Tax=Paraburkholderia sp. 40 TaxID=2991059 RepID=UPI003D21FBF4